MMKSDSNNVKLYTTAIPVYNNTWNHRPAIYIIISSLRWYKQPANGINSSTGRITALRAAVTLFASLFICHRQLGQSSMSHIGRHDKEDGRPHFMPRSRLLDWRLLGCRPPLCAKVYLAVQLAVWVARRLLWR